MKKIISMLLACVMALGLFAGCTTLGAADNAIGLPTENWSLEKCSVADYNALYTKLRDGSVVVDRDYETGLKNENFANVNLVLD